MRPFRVLAIAIVTLCASSLAHAEDLHLVCSGAGTYPATSSEGELQTINADIRFELAGDAARILMPPAMTPTINGGSDRGWWTLDRLEVTEDAISGRFDLNLFNKPRVHIDRHTGVIEVDGNFRYYFLGECRLAEEQPTRRF